MNNLKANLLISILLFTGFCWLAYPVKKAEAGYGSLDKIIERFRADGDLEYAIQKNCAENIPYGVIAADRDEFCRLAGYNQPQVAIQPSQEPILPTQPSPSPKVVVEEPLTEEEPASEDANSTASANEQEEPEKSNNEKPNILKQIFRAIANFFSRLFKR